MKIIDADAFKKRLEEMYKDPWNMAVSTSWSEAYEQFCMELDEEPDLNGPIVLEEVESYYPCTVQILRNPKTGEESVGWFRGEMDG